MELNTVIWEHSVVGRGRGKNVFKGRRESFSSPSSPGIWQIFSVYIHLLFPFYFDFRVPSVECGRGRVSYSLFFFGLCFVFDYFHCSKCFPLQNQWQTTLEGGRDGMWFCIHGLEHSISWIKCLWVSTLQKSQFWGESILWLLFATTVLCSCK